MKNNNITVNNNINNYTKTQGALMSCIHNFNM